jgi:hypothetical protein
MRVLLLSRMYIYGNRGWEERQAGRLLRGI